MRHANLSKLVILFACFIGSNVSNGQQLVRLQALRLGVRLKGQRVDTTNRNCLPNQI